MINILLLLKLLNVLLNVDGVLLLVVDVGMVVGRSSEESLSEQREWQHKENQHGVIDH